VWDLDLKHPGLQFPCTLQQYAGHALQSGTIDLPPQFHRCVLAEHACSACHLCCVSSLLPQSLLCYRVIGGKWDLSIVFRLNQYIISNPKAVFKCG